VGAGRLVLDAFSGLLTLITRAGSRVVEGRPLYQHSASRTGITGIGEVDIALDPPAEIVHGMLLVTRAGSLVEAYTATRDTVTLSTSLAPGEVAVVRYQSRSA
jgi:hypothetical protein